MPALDEPRHELFAQLLASGIGVGDAYERAGYVRNDGNGSRLKSDERIKGRVREILQQTASRVVVDRDWVRNQLIDTYIESRNAENYAPAVGALKLLAVDAGMLSERQQTDVSIKDAPDYRILMDTLLRALKPYPDALRAVVSALGQINAHPPALVIDGSATPAE